MYQKFTATNFDIDKPTKNIYLSFSHDINEDTITKSSLYIEDADGEMLDRTITVDGLNVIIHIDGEIKPNVEYTMYATRGIESALGQKLSYRINKKFIFDTTVRSSVRIISPSNFEETDDTVNIEWEECVDSENQRVNKFYIEISDDHLFENIIVDTKVSNKNKIKLSGLKKPGQHFIRIRTQTNEEDYGAWSDIVTFIYKDGTQDISAPNNEDDITPSDNDDYIIYQKELEVLIEPEQGETPSSFIIEFSSPIDPESICEDNIFLVQRRI